MLWRRNHDKYFSASETVAVELLDFIHVFIEDKGDAVEAELVSMSQTSLFVHDEDAKY
jgi:hypothetical protein